MIKLTTINQIVEAILKEGDERAKKIPDGMGFDKTLTEKKYAVIANEAVIYYKTAMICEDGGIEKAMEYFTGTHSEDEFQEFRTSVVKPKEFRPEHLKRMRVTMVKGGKNGKRTKS